ncbi:MAG: tRNA (5-methylaminomethyl-2-thiouridine)(34)-methyltransferase MnmD [Bacteroidales bacterium]|nr:tRNA (5-methylaminomethyl-2-thiouridine)(34)-methyltransferase MnmD [Bacteroidales bacterium]
MNRTIKVTGDGSHTLFNNDLREPYHSINGAIAESMHVFIRHGLNACTKSKIRILEIGFGTGLNMLLTLIQSETRNIKIYYQSVDKYPLESFEYSSLNYPDILGEHYREIFLRAHECEWETKVTLSKNFTLYKERTDFRGIHPDGKYNIVYYDAFAPDKQPELWDLHIFRMIYDSMVTGGIWVSYTSKGTVQRNLKSAGFKVEKLPGPPGKREMLRALKIS